MKILSYKQLRKFHLALMLNKSMYLKMGMAYDGAAASLRSFSAIAHCPAWHGLQLAGDMAIGDSHGLRVPCT